MAKIELTKWQKDGAICALMDMWFVFINFLSWAVLPAVLINIGYIKTGVAVGFVAFAGFVYFCKIKGKLDLGE